LPAELLPTDWIGTRAARLFQRQHALWEPPGRLEWERISAQAQ
jgi:DNA-binding transcriptional regulator PaaX